MQHSCCIWFDEGRLRSKAGLSKADLTPHRGPDFQPIINGLLNHPVEGELGKAAFLLGVATANVCVNTREPNLFDILRN